MTNNKPAVLISIKPKWCELIANGKKTVEIRKSMPKLETPFKVYIYCTTPKGENDLGLCLDKGIDGSRKKVGLVYKRNYEAANQMNMSILSGKVIGEFVCTKIDRIHKRGINDNFDYCYLSLNVFGNDDIEIEITDIKKSCIKKEDLNSYGANSNVLYAWHISNLVIYDEPKELSEFSKLLSLIEKVRDEEGYLVCDGCKYAKWDGRHLVDCNDKTCNQKIINKPPQSWCYIESKISKSIGKDFI